jgi:hypothetical protein
MVEILWHRRETRRQTEKTKLNLKHWKKPVYSTKSAKTSPDTASDQSEHGSIKGVTYKKEGNLLTQTHDLTAWKKPAGSFERLQECCKLRVTHTLPIR